MQKLSQEADSFLILEQKDPRDSEIYWFIQCAVARQGPDQGKYAVEIGSSVSGSPCLWERTGTDVQAIGYFSAAYYHMEVDVSGFEEMNL